MASDMVEYMPVGIFRQAFAISVVEQRKEGAERSKFFTCEISVDKDIKKWYYKE